MLVLEKWWWYLLELESEHILHRLSLYCISLISSTTLVFPLEVRLGLTWGLVWLLEADVPGALRAAAAGWEGEDLGLLVAPFLAYILVIGWIIFTGLVFILTNAIAAYRSG